MLQFVNTDRAENPSHDEIPARKKDSHAICWQPGVLLGKQVLHIFPWKCELPIMVPITGEVAILAALTTASSLACSRFWLARLGLNKMSRG